MKPLINDKDIVQSLLNLRDELVETEYHSSVLFKINSCLYSGYKLEEKKTNNCGHIMKQFETEIWKPIKDYEDAYEVSDHGRVRGIDRLRSNGKKQKGKVLSAGKMTNGYLFVSLWKNGKNEMRRVHRIVAESFIQNPDEKKCVNHINAIRHDNRVENLEWCTHSENNKHAYKMGREHPMQGKTGKDNPTSKPIRAIHCITGDEITFSGLNEAHRNGFSRRNIWSVLNGAAKTHKGYRWEYA